MKDIITLPATEDLLKKYVLKLYARKNQVGDLCFDESKINALIVNKSYKEITCSELLDCCFITFRWGNEIFEQFIPTKFYCFTANEKTSDNIEDYPFLYTSIEPLDSLPLYKADFGLNGLGCDIIDGKGNILISLHPNLYDNGFIEVSVTPDKSILVFNYDENNAESFDLFYYDDVQNKLIRKHEIEDKDLVFNIINEKGYATILSLASDEIKNNKDLVLTALKTDPYCYMYVGERIKYDRDVILAAIRSNADAFSDAPENIQNDHKFIQMAVSYNPKSLNYVSESLRNEPDIIMAAANDKTFAALEFASSRLREDPVFVMQMIEKCGDNICFAADWMRAEKQFVIAAIHAGVSSRTLEYLPENLRNDEEIISELQKKG
jgi:hypothetical protein